MKLLIVDDHPVFRQGFAAIVRQSWDDAVVSHANDAAEAIASVKAASDLDLVVLDLLIPGSGGLELIDALGQIRPDLPVLILTSSEDQGHMRDALARGACGYVPKSAAASTLVSAIRLVLGGDIYVPPLAVAHASPRPLAGALTPRQLDVLRRLAEGRSNKDIARALGLSEKTVKAHLVSMFKVFGVANRTQAIAAARAASLL